MKTLLKSLIIIVLLAISSLSIFSQSAPNLRCTKFIDEFNGSIAVDNGIVQLTTNSGASWREINTGYPNNLYCICQPDPTTIVTVGQGGIILKSMVDFSMWNQIPSGVIYDLRSMDMNSMGNMITAGDNGTVLLSNDMGDTWVPSATNTTSNLNQVIFVSDQVVYAVGDNSTVLRSNDGGLTWLYTVIPPTTYSINFYSVAFDNAGNNGLIVGDNQTIFETFDGGDSWHPTSSMQGGITLYHAKYLSSGDAVIVGQAQTIINVSSARAHSFSLRKLSASCTADLYCLSFSSKMAGMTVGTTGTKLYTNDAGATWTATYQGNSKSTVNNKPKKLEVRNYPNPFNPSTMISYTLPFDANVILKVYDMSGKEVTTLVNSNETAGGYSVRFNASNLASGIYFYKLIAASGSRSYTETRKMILAK